MPIVKRKLAKLTALAWTLGACTWPPRDTGFDADKLCALHVAARESGDNSEFLLAVERELGVEPSSIRPDREGDGFFVKTSEFFVEEQGFFIAKPGAVLLRSTDPSFEPLRSCFHRYRRRG